MKHFIFLFSLLFIISCKPNEDKNVDSTKTEETESHSHEGHDHSSHSHDKANNSVTTSNFTNNLNQLQGEWKSVTNKEDGIKIEGTNWNYIKNNVEQPPFRFSMNESCTDSRFNVGATKEDHFINFENGNQCLYIVSISSESLNIGNMGKGTSESYIKMK